MVNLVLLGQYGVSGRLTGEFQDLVANSNAKLVLAGDDGLLWLETNSEKSLPLLRSTRILLKTLKESIPGDDGDEDDDEDQMEITPSVLSVNEGDEKDTAAAQDEEMADEEMIVDENDTAKSDTSPVQVPDSDQPFQELVRVENTATLILNALQHIQSLRRETDGTPKRGRNSRNRRLEALEHQRQRLQKQLISTDDDDEDLCDKSVDDDPVMDAWIQLASALNSLHILTPILLSIFFHERRNDDSLVIKGKSLPKQKRRPSCWLIGSHVYDRCTNATSKRLYQVLLDTFQGLKIDKSHVKLGFNKWAVELECLMKQVVEASATPPKQQATSQPSSPTKLMPAAQKNKPMPCTTTKLPFDNEAFFSSAKDKEKLTSLAQRWDEELGLQNTKDQVEHGLFRKAVEKLHTCISNQVLKVFPDAVLSIYGSCLSDLSLGKSSDVDLSIYIAESEKNKMDFESGSLSAKEYEKYMRKTVFHVCRLLERRRSEFVQMNPVARARVPVVMGTYLHAGNPYSEDGSMAFDICFLNDIAVVNSSLLREYSLVDPRAKQLMIAVKKWSKSHKISSARDSTFSSYTWTNMVVFYLQNIGLVPNLQNQQLLEKTGVAFEKNNRFHSINNLNTRFVKWEQAKAYWAPSPELLTLPVSALLYGFFQFYSTQFNCKLYLISIKRGRDVLLPKTVFRSTSLGLVIEDPFETFDSHCPHDLANHANQSGMKKIMNCIDKAEEYLRNQFLTGLKEDSVVHNGFLWPLHDDEETLPTPNTGNKTNTITTTKNGQDGGDQKTAKKNNKKSRGKRNNKSAKTAIESDGEIQENPAKVELEERKDQHGNVSESDSMIIDDDAQVNGDEQAKDTAKSGSSKRRNRRNKAKAKSLLNGKSEGSLGPPEADNIVSKEAEDNAECVTDENGEEAAVTEDTIQELNNDNEAMLNENASSTEKATKNGRGRGRNRRRQGRGSQKTAIARTETESDTKEQKQGEQASVSNGIVVAEENGTQKGGESQEGSSLQHQSKASSKKGGGRRWRGPRNKGAKSQPATATEN